MAGTQHGTVAAQGNDDIDKPIFDLATQLRIIQAAVKALDAMSLEACGHIGGCFSRLGDLGL